jgi:protoporphyrin/coproporphyrin ferrochelatase
MEKQKNKTAVLLANLGSPDSYEVKDVRNYLREFLMDERVIDIPKILRTILVKGIIVPFRAPKSAAKYKTVWTENGSPLIHISKQVQAKLQSHLQLPVELCMRYANPTPQAALDRLHKNNPDLEEVILVPLYPHYAMSSYETAVEQVKQIHKKNGYAFKLKVVPPFYNNPTYIQSLANSIKPFLQNTFDHILFSYHGIPERHVKKTDATKAHCLVNKDCCNVFSAAHQTCYQHQVKETTKLTAQLLGLPKEKFSVSFQSRLGADAWLKPFTVEQLASFPQQGIKKLLIVCPAFVSDCLETLEEIQMEGRETFMENGGEEFTVIPCLNENQEWIEALAGLVQDSKSMIQDSKPQILNRTS